MWRTPRTASETTITIVATTYLHLHTALSPILTLVTPKTNS